MTKWSDVIESMEQRGVVENKIIQSLAHFDRERAMHLILSWFSIKDLEEIAPTLSGDPDILKNEMKGG